MSPPPSTTLDMATIQQQTNRKITSLTENLILLLENTISGSTLYAMSEKINFQKLIQTEYSNNVFEHELFGLLVKNKYAITNNTSGGNNIVQNENLLENINDNINYSSVKFPFSLVICSSAVVSNSIRVSNVGMVLIKFILCLRMLHKKVATPECQNCLLATDMGVLPFGRICIDVDYKTTVFVNDDLPTNKEYEEFIDECFNIVCSFTTTGNIIMTQNCFTPNTRSFHLITEQQFDSATQEVILFKISEGIKSICSHVKVDRVQTWMLPFGRGHIPVRKYDRKTCEFINLSFPYNEIDFELCMPFDLNMGIDNLYTLLTYDNTDDTVDDMDSADSAITHDVLNEYLNEEIVRRYHIRGVHNIKENLQSFVKVMSFKYDFGFMNRNNFRYEYNYLPQIFSDKYNNFFLIMSNKKLLFENNWQIPKSKIKQRPVEFYEIYRFIEHRFINGIENMKDLFALMPRNLIQKNVTIGNVDEIMPERNVSFESIQNVQEINQVYSGNMQFDFTFSEILNHNRNVNDFLKPKTKENPWPYMTEHCNELSSIASVDTKYIYEFFRKTIRNNVYPYEKSSNILTYFQNLQSIIHNSLFVQTITQTCNNILVNGDIISIQNHIFPLYEFFCRTHYIKSCVTMAEYEQVRVAIMVNTPIISIDEETFTQYRQKNIEFSPSKQAYRCFPYPNTPLAEIWRHLKPEHKILLHILYMLMVEHNYTSVFFYLHKIVSTSKNNQTYLVCSLLLNILDESYVTQDNQKVISYSSKEFLNFLYMTFINAGPNVRCGFDNGNVLFNMVTLESLVTDMETMFVASPIWFFLSNFQYMDENMEFTKRCDLFLQIFQQPPQVEASTSNRGGQENDSRADRGPPPAKQQKLFKASTFVPDKYLKMHHINEKYHSNLLSIFYKNIISICNTENGIYIYDGKKFCSPSQTIAHTPQMIKDPAKYSPIYRHQFGIYNTWTMQYERNTSTMYTQVNISNDDFYKYPELFNAYNDDVYKIIVNRFLKGITFTQILKNQKNLALFLAPIYEPDMENIIHPETLNYNIDSIQMNIHDLSSSEFILPDEMFCGILQTKNKLYEMFKWLYAIICHYSENFSCIITNPGSFIPKCILPTTETTPDSNGCDSSYSMFQQHLVENRSLDTDTNKGENLMQRIHKILNSKKTEQQQNITDELQKLSQNELTSLIILFDNITKCDENSVDSSEEVLCSNHDGGSLSPSTESSSSSLTSISSQSVSEGRNNDRDKNGGLNEYITKFNLSTRGSNGNTQTDALMFYNNDEYMDNTKNKLLLDLFNRQVSDEISQMSPELFEKVITENFSTHISKFVLLTLSWLIRTLHVHIFTDTKFFRELQQNRQLLYDEMCELVFKYNGEFLYNNSIVDVVEIFKCYCKNTKLVVDPTFETTFAVDDDMYLGYDEAIENRVPRDVIEDIEAGCVSGIYQGQFIENTNVDLNRLWSRVTVPRNRHRISPLFSLHTSTGKSEYLSERCKKHFNNKHTNNFLDATSMKTNERGIDMARELNSNLVVCVEEFSNLSEKFKQICGHSSITYKPLWADNKSSFQNNATVLLATNNDPKCTEAAVIARLHPYPRRIQYVTVNKYSKFKRAAMCSAAIVLNVNNIFAVQLILEKMPGVMVESVKGNFMMTWILKRFFLYNILDPVTVQRSETLQKHIDGFYSMINAPQLVLDRLELNKGEMKLLQFRKLVTRICEDNRNIFGTKINSYDVYKEIYDRLKSMIDTETGTIRVSEKPEK